VLLVHGWGGDGREWSPHAEALAGHARVIVPDLRGHGRSEVPEEGNTPAEMADDLAALLDTLDPGPVTAVGHSMGGQVVNLLAVRHPHLVRSVVALDPAHGTAVEAIPARLADYRATGARAAAAFVAAAFGHTAPPGLRTAHLRTMLGTPGHVIAQSCAGSTPTRARSASVRSARRTCAAAPRPRSRSGPRRRRPPGSAAP
jgi:pimeloyl-ACP methyl ester carboxylesterase